MPAKFNEYDRILQLIEQIAPTGPMRRHDIANIKMIVDLSLSISHQDKQQLQIRLFYLGIEDLPMSRGRKKSPPEN